MDDAGPSRLADNIVHFCRTLRHAGLPVGTGAVLDALTAVAAAGIRRQDDFRYALRAVLVKDPADFELFEQAFTLYFRRPPLLDRLLSILLPALEGQQAASGPQASIRRLMELFAGERQPGTDGSSLEIDRAGSYSSREVLSKKDFAQMNLEELEETRRLLRDGKFPVPVSKSRRFRSSIAGGRYDLRKSLQLMMRCHGNPVQLARRRQRTRQATLVLLCDISESMSMYSRMFLLYAHALSVHSRLVHTFVFGTRLTNISCWLRCPDADKALRRVSTQVPDWDGGTRIADCLQRFNVDWSRRVLDSNASVILLSDGLERDSAAQLQFQMQRLQHSCRQLIWMNPMLRFAAFEPRAGGIRAMLPHVDRFVPAHNIASIAELGGLLADVSLSRGARIARIAA